MSEFPDKNQKRRGLEELLKKTTRNCDDWVKKGSGRLGSPRTKENVSSVEEVDLSQDGQPQRHRPIIPCTIYE